MEKYIDETSKWQNECRKRAIALNFWTAGWVLSLALAVYGPKMLWGFQTELTILGVLVVLGVGFGMIMATKRHLQSMDEMQQKIFRDAAVLSLGVGLICGTTYELLEDIRLISFEPEISHLIMLMALTFITGAINGHRQYR